MEDTTPAAEEEKGTLQRIEVEGEKRLFPPMAKPYLQSFKKILDKKDT